MCVLVALMTSPLPGVDFPLTPAKMNLTIQHIFNVSTTNAILQRYSESRFSYVAAVGNVIAEEFLTRTPRRRGRELTPFPTSPPRGPFEQLSIILRDYFFLCPTK